MRSFASLELFGVVLSPVTIQSTMFEQEHMAAPLYIISKVFTFLFFTSAFFVTCCPAGGSSVASVGLLACSAL